MCPSSYNTFTGNLYVIRTACVNDEYGMFTFYFPHMSVIAVIMTLRIMLDSQNKLVYDVKHCSVVI